MTKLIINGAVSLLVGFMVFGMVNDFIDAQNTTGWPTMATSISDVAPTILLLAVAIGLFGIMTTVGGKG